MRLGQLCSWTSTGTLILPAAACCCYACCRAARRSGLRAGGGAGPRSARGGGGGRRGALAGLAGRAAAGAPAGRAARPPVPSQRRQEGKPAATPPVQRSPRSQRLSKAPIGRHGAAGAPQTLHRGPVQAPSRPSLPQLQVRAPAAGADAPIAAVRRKGWGCCMEADALLAWWRLWGLVWHDPPCPAHVTGAGPRGKDNRLPGCAAAAAAAAAEQRRAALPLCHPERNPVCKAGRRYTQHVNGTTGNKETGSFAKVE